MVKLMIGTGRTDVGREAFVWTAAGGMQSLHDLLLSRGVNEVAGWTLFDASAISADGRTITGNGLNPSGGHEAWIATVPEPSAVVLMACAGVGLVGAALQCGTIDRLLT